jgi:hypothetical protein
VKPKSDTWDLSAQYVDAQVAIMQQQQRFGSMPTPWTRARRRAVIRQVDRHAQELRHRRQRLVPTRSETS